ncbi:MAG: RecX family transcriptional regulator [Anaerolineae bacterium]|nr:RecX family transcriptional regulator [Phycisphaerae bacterium]
MPVITQISEQKRRENRRNIFLDGVFAFGCNINVVARFKLREGMKLSDEQVRAIQLGAVKQECFDKAMRYLQTRLHSRSELQKKLKRQEWGDAVIDAVLEDLTRMQYLDDARFAKTKALSAAEHKKHGRRRAFVELIKSGVKGDIATRALEDVYEPRDSTRVARELAMKQRARLIKLDPLVARRRLFGMLQRRGFEYDEIRPVIDDVLGRGHDAE